MQLNQPNQARKIDHLELSEEHYNQILAHLSNTPYKHAAPILDLMTKATTIVFQDQLGRPNPVTVPNPVTGPNPPEPPAPNDKGPGVPRGRIIDKPEVEPEEGEHVPIMTLKECADAEEADDENKIPWEPEGDEVAKPGAGGAQ